MLTFLSWKLFSWVQVWAAVVSNVVSALLGLVGVAYLGFLIAIYRPAKLFCDDEHWGYITPTETDRNNCLWKISLLDVSLSGREHGCRGNRSKSRDLNVLFQASEYGSLGLLLVLLVLQVCVSITVCVFSVRAIRRHGHSSTVSVRQP